MSLPFRRPWPIRLYFVLLCVLGLATAVSAALYVNAQAERDARRDARRDAQFSATIAAKTLGEHVALLRATTANLAANPQMEQLLKTPEGCTLTFQGIAASDASHLDILRADGTVACSSQKITPQAAETGYRGSSWLRHSLREPALVAPTVDEASGAKVAIATAPIGKQKGVVAGFVDLTLIAKELASQYGGGRETVFLVTTNDGTVLSRSQGPATWAGRKLTEPQRQSLAESDRQDLDGTERLYARVPVPGVGWSFHVGEKQSEVLASVNRLRDRQLTLILVGLAIFFLAVAVVYRMVVTPIRRLSLGLRRTQAAEPDAAVPVSGPAEVTTLGQDVNDLIGSVQSELLERRRAEESANASEERYRLLFEGNPSPMWVYDTESLRFLTVNDAAVETYGFSREEFLTMRIEDIRPSSEADRLNVELASPERQATYGYRNAGLWQHRRKDGSLLDVEIRSHDHFFDERPARVVTALDVTDRVRAEGALRHSEARYRDLFENATDLISAVDLDGLLTAVNEAFVSTTGYSREELIGMPIADLVPAEDRERLLVARDTKLEGTRTTLYQIELIARDGHRIPVEVASRLIEEDGRPIGTEAICRDVSERLLLEEQLRQSQRLEAVGRLAGGVAHDFNNILTVIGGYTEALLADGEYGTDEIEQIASATTRATHLTRQLLAFSRQQVLQPQALIVNGIVDGLMPMLTRVIGEDVELETSLEPGLDPVLADAGQLEQVLVNLAVNARDAMPDGGHLTIQTANVELDEEYVAHHGEASIGRHVLLSVADTGSGMDAETLAHAFEPFYTTKPVGVGTGLGLATVYGIVKQSGGSVWVYSEPGKGTTFKIYLPTTDAPVREPSQALGPAAADGVETILLAEDEEALRTLTARMLSQRGYNVIVAETSPEALRIAEQESDGIDLLLTDLVMPELSGRALAEHIGRIAPRIPVLFMSGYSNDAVMRNGSLQLGAAFLEKPFTGNELAAKVRQTLDATRLQPSG